MSSRFDEKANAQTNVVAASDISLTHADVRSADDARLAELGYKGEFRREFSLIETVAFAFSIMAVIGGVSSTLSFGLASGGHVGMVWGWGIPCIFVMCIAASMAELTSSMPTSAGLYYFSAKLAPERYSALASWITGWANVTGQITLVCSIDYTVAQMITTAIAVNTDGAVILGAGPTYGILLAILVIHGIICSAATKILARLNLFYGFLTAGATVAAIVALLVCSGDRKVSTKTAFTSFENNTGWRNDGWAFLLAFAAPMWSLTGYDSAAHISEEVAGAARAAPIAILTSVAAVGGMGWLLIIAVSFATVSVPALLETDLALPMGQVLLDVLGKRGMLAIWSFTIIAQFLCGAAQGVDASRVVFAFARDNALPGSRWWKRVNAYTQTPVNAVWLVIALSALCGLLGFSATAFNSLAGASVVGLYTSYATPIFLRITSGRDKLVPGPFSLGRWYMPIGAVSVVWVSFIVVLLCFPPSQRVNAAEMNYASVIVLAVFVFAGGSWVLSARKWFVGPLPNVDVPGYSEKQT
ncbi:amino acid transporter [Trametes versicolor FP-101664 SS1]|uniref:amino acid transporter n=1 Tax=Trametes versicolor (strain FP-101664) TaxID=717944 RepID=UPI000462198F|nr:amino acid transporter [Trametes versicolor FP-101664 SS1]EIW52380.1 amino acid transporter [Trametes versicolor FP-101664 SS1]